MENGENKNGQESHLDQDKNTHEAAGEIVDRLFGNSMDADESDLDGQYEDEEQEEPAEEEQVDDSEEEGQEGEEGEEKEGEEEPAKQEDLAAQLGFIQESVKDILPDQKFETAEDYQQAVKSLAERHRAVEDDLKREVETSSDLANLFEKNPELVSVIRKLRDGKTDFYEALYDVVDPNMVVPDKKTDPEGYAKYILQRERQAEQQRSQKEQEEQSQKEQKERYKRHMQDSEREIEAFKQANKIDDSGIDAISEFLTGVVKELAEGKISQQVLNMAYKAMNYEKDLAGAKEKGEVEGRNKATTDYRRQRAGDGLPKLPGTGKGKQKATPKGGDFLSSLEQMGADSMSDTW